MTFNEFNRELEKRIGDPQARYMFAMLYEKVHELGEQIDVSATALLQMAQTMEKFVTMSEHTVSAIRRIERRHMHDGVEVSSMAPEPEDT